MLKSSYRFNSMAFLFDIFIISTSAGIIRSFITHRGVVTDYTVACICHEKFDSFISFVKIFFQILHFKNNKIISDSS